LVRFAEAPTPTNLNFLFHKSYSISPADLRKSILTLAVQGKLTQQNDDESSPYRSASDNYPSSFKFRFPKNWRFAQLKRVVTATQGVQIPKEEQFDFQKPCLKRYLYISDFKKGSSLKFVNDAYPQKEVSPNDLIMMNTGATSGQVFYGVHGILSNNLFRISFAEYFDQRFLYIVLSSSMFRDKVFGGVKGGANPHLGHKTFGEQSVPIPPFAEQRRIVAKVDELMPLVDASENQLNASRSAAAMLLEAVLAELTKS
jgi:type I restriction enzyme S subunit